MAYLGLSRRTPYSDIIRAEAPYAQQDYFKRLARERERDRFIAQKNLAERQLTQSSQQFEDTLGLNKAQLAESQRQFAETTALQQQQLEEEAARANLATGISAAGLGIEAYPYVKEGVTGLGELLFAEPAATTTAGTTAAGTTGTTAGIGATEVGAAGESASGASSGLGAAGNTAAILAIIAGQHRLADLTETEFEGQRTGDFFTFDEQGRWSPRFGNEPWHGFMNQQWGAGPSAGEKWDAAVYNQDWGLAARRTPAMVQQWLNPVGDFGYDIIESKWGPQVSGTLDPITYSFDKLAEARDIGEAVGAGAQASAKVMDPVGTLAGETIKEKVTDWTGNETLGDIANVMVNPIGAAADFVSNWSYLCTETKKIIGLASSDQKHLDNLNRFSKEHILAKHYYANAPKLIRKIEESVEDLEAFYATFYAETIAPVVQLIKKGDMILARNRYLTDYLNLLEIYAPELMPEIKNA